MTILASGLSGRVTDVVRERGQIIEQGAEAMYRQAILAKLVASLAFAWSERRALATGDARVARACSTYSSFKQHRL